MLFATLLYMKPLLFFFFVALQALQNFFAALVYSANTSFDKLLDSLLSTAKPSPQSGGVAKQALFSIAQCVAVLCLAAGDQKCSATVKMLTDILKDDSATNSVRFSLSLLFGLHQLFLICFNGYTRLLYTTETSI